MYYLKDFLPAQSYIKIINWINELNVKVNISNPRRTKLGDFKVENNNLIISINNDLNPYSFLITLTHELAHAYVYKKYKRRFLPHGEKWQETFRSMMLNFLNTSIFPSDVLEVLSIHLKKPKASTFTDLALAMILKKYDTKDRFTISDISEGSIFVIKNGRKFKKGKKLRKRYKCLECSTNKIYLFHPLAEVILC